tara:strand:+ start:375 stop:536 length:162 start_codon:yes stop_codon:yes gene_type:complete
VVKILNLELRTSWDDLVEDDPVCVSIDELLMREDARVEFDALVNIDTNGVNHL